MEKEKNAAIPCQNSMSNSPIGSTANSSKFVGSERHLIPLTRDLWYNFHCANCDLVSLEPKKGARGENLNRLKKGKRR